MDLKNKKLTIVGLGKSGMAAAVFLANRGAIVRATDGFSKPEVVVNAARLKKIGVSVEIGGHTESFVEGADWVVTSPGVSRESVPLLFARKKNIPVISEIELASFFCPGLIVGVTGSNGKTTTSHLIHQILLDAGRDSVLCGNVGVSFMETLGRITGKTVVVLELSSFQLEDCRQFSPKIATLLNVSPNHLDRHKTMENYISAKANIFSRQKKDDFLVLNADDPTVFAMATQARSNVVFFGKDQEGGIRDRVRSGQIHLEGDHNLENMLAAAAVANILKIPPESVLRSFSSFRTLEHRIEPVGRLVGVSFVNDSKSTTVASTRAAILAMRGPLILLAGGRDKGSDFSQIEPLLESSVKRVVLYGESRGKIAAAWKKFQRFEQTESFDAAVRLAFQSAVSGDTLLLSPMCTSFDQFSCFEERGERFKGLFKELQSEGLESSAKK